jgi:hypothetical protein
VLDEEVLAFDDVSPSAGDIQQRRARLEPVLFPADVAVRPVMIRSRADLG